MHYIVIPDIHGQYGQFLKIEAMLRQEAECDPDVHIIFLGDYIDRGEGGIYRFYHRRLRKEVELYFEDIGSRQVAERLMKLKSFFDVRGVAATLLRGNHERYFIENVKVLERGNDLLAIFEAKQDNRSRKTYQEMIGCIKGFTQEFDLLKECKNFFAAMPYFFHDVQNNLSTLTQRS